MRSLLCARCSARDRGDGQMGKFLAMTDPAAISLLRLVLEDDDLLAAEVVVDACRDCGALNGWSSDLGRAVAAEQQHALERYVATGLVTKPFDRDAVTHAHAVLFSAGLD